VRSQRRRGAPGCFWKDSQSSWWRTSVSYTHLDVYKRQVVHEAAQEAEAEKFGEFGGAAGRGEMKLAVFIEHAAGGEDVEVGMENEVVAEGVQGGNGGDFAGGRCV